MRNRTYTVDLDRRSYERPLYKQFDNNIPLNLKIIDKGTPIDLTGYTVSAFFDNGTDIIQKNTVIGADKHTVTVILDNNILKNANIINYYCNNTSVRNIIGYYTSITL